MSDPINAGLVVTAGKTVAPVVGKQAKKFRRRNEVKNLVRAVRRRVERNDRLPERTRTTIARRLKSLWRDPNTLGCLRALLDDGDQDVLPALRENATRVLLRDDDDWEGGSLIEAVIEAANVELVRAKRTDRDALSLSTHLVRTDVAAARTDLVRVEQKLLEAIERQSAGGVHGVEPYGSPPPTPSSLASSQLGETSGEARRWLQELATADPELSQRVSNLVDGLDTHRLHDWVLNAPAELENANLAGLAALGRLLMSTGHPPGARTVFERAAQLDPDPIRQLTRAANAASADDDEAASDGLLARARALGGENHPAVVLAEIRRWQLKPEDALMRLASAQPEDRFEEALFAATEAQLHLLLGEWDTASASLDRAESLEPENLLVREVRAVALLSREQERMRTEHRVESEPLRRAAASFLHLREELAALHRYGESGAMLARAAEAHLLRHDYSEARRLLGEDFVTAPEATGSSRLLLADAAMTAGLPKRVLALIPADDTSSLAQLLRADAALFDEESSPETLSEAAARLEALLHDQDAEIRERAALSRALAASSQPTIGWSSNAERILRQRDPVAADLIRADAHVAAGEWNQAEALYVRHTSQRHALRGLVDVAVGQREWVSAVRRHETVMQARTEPEDTVRYAELLREAKRDDDALATFLAAGRNQQASHGLRVHAYRAAAQLAQRLLDSTDIEAMCDEWLQLAPRDHDAHWVRAFARARRCEYAAALAALDEANIEPANLDQARLLAQLLHRSVDVATALARLTELSDRFSRPEDIEVAIIVTAQRRHSDLDPALRTRIQATFNEFAVRFPDSKQIVVIEIPRDPDELRAWLNQFAPDPSGPREAHKQVMDGTLPVAAVAMAASRSLAETWANVAPLPIGFSSKAIDDLEREDARASIGTPVVVDVSALVVLSHVAETHRDTLLGALPGSRIAEPALHDIDHAAAPVGEPEAAAGTLTRDDSGQAVFVEADLADARKLRDRLATVVNLAKTLSPRHVADDDDLVTDLLGPRGLSERSAMAALVATLILAREEQLPVWSDDRWFRVALRQAGIPAFSTQALIEVLAERSVLDDDGTQRVRDALLAVGALGLHPTGAELFRCLGTDNAPTHALFHGLADAHAWENATQQRYLAAVRFCEECWNHDPAWLHEAIGRCLDAPLRTTPLTADVHAFRFIVALIGLGTDEPSAIPAHFAHAVIAAIRALPPALRGSGDPVRATFDRLMLLTARADPQARARVLLRAISRLPITDQMWAFARYVA